MDKVKTFFSSTLSVVLGIIVVAIVIGVLGLTVYRVGFLTFVDNYEFAYMFDTRTGQATPLYTDDGEHYKHGYIKVIPFIKLVHTIDMRPNQICIGGGNSGNSSSASSLNSRVLNCKLVRFNPDGFQTFIAWHGRGDYNHNDLEGILKNYAYDQSGHDYPFITIDKELKTQDYDTNDNGLYEVSDSTNSTF